MLVGCKEVLRTKHFLRDAFKEYLQDVEVNAPENEERITILNKSE